MGNVKIGGVEMAVASKDDGRKLLDALKGKIAKGNVTLLTTMLDKSVGKGAFTLDVWVENVRTMVDDIGYSARGDGWRKVFIDAHPELKDKVEAVERAVAELDKAAGSMTVDGEKDGKAVKGKLTYRIVVNFVPPTTPKAEAAPAPATPAKAGTPATAAPATGGPKRK